MNTSRKIALFGAIALAIVYETILFTTVIRSAYGLSLSLFFTYLFSLVAAAPFVIIFIVFARQPSSTKREMLRR
jgi:hypothetical protein